MKVFDLEKIEASLQEVQEQFHRINEELTLKREPLSDSIKTNILLAYEYINSLLSKDIDLFSRAGLYSMLELNHIILCGTDPAQRERYFQHIEHTRKRFQKNIKEIKDWYDSNRKKKNIFKLASNFYVMALSQPQLFFEGNHRTENIVVNYLLVSEKENPYILNAKSAVEYFEPSGLIKFSNKKQLKSRFTYPGYKKDFSAFLQKHSHSDYLK